jgi:anti-anti-sigma factor
MDMQVDELDGGITNVVLSGRFDLKATETVDMPFSVIAGSKRSVLVDLSRVDFLASLGIRILVSSAKTILRRGGKLVIVAPEGNALTVLKTAGIESLIPIFGERSAAVAVLS